MITSAQIYWITRLTYLNFLFGVPGTICTLGSFVCLLVAAMLGGSAGGDESEIEFSKIWFKYGFRSGVIGIILMGISCFIPTTKEMAAILLIPKVANNEQIQKLPGNILTLANEWLEELKPEKEKK